MKKMYHKVVALLVIIWIFLAEGCSVPTFYGLYQHADSTSVSDKSFAAGMIKNITDSMDVKLFYKTVSNLKIPDGMTSKIERYDKISLYSSDKVQNDFSDMDHIIQNALINKLLEQNYIILERDYLPLLKVYNEKFFLSKGLFSNDTVKNMIVDPKPNSILLADKLIMYKVLEAGIKKIKIPGSSSVIRYAGIIIRFDLVDVSSSRILASETAESFNHDEISEKLNSAIEAFHFENTGFSMPLLNGYLNSRQSIYYPQNIKSVSLKFIPGKYRATASVIDKLGNEVLNFNIPTSYDSQSFEYNWDMKNHHGEQVPEGEYVVRIMRFQQTISSSVIYLN